MRSAEIYAGLRVRHQGRASIVRRLDRGPLGGLRAGILLLEGPDAGTTRNVRPLALSCSETPLRSLSAGRKP